MLCLPSTTPCDSASAREKLASVYRQGPGRARMSQNLIAKRCQPYLRHASAKKALRRKAYRPPQGFLKGDVLSRWTANRKLADCCQRIVAAAQLQSLAALNLQIGVLGMDPLEQMTFGAHLHLIGQRAGNVLHGIDQIE